MKGRLRLATAAAASLALVVLSGAVPVSADAPATSPALGPLDRVPSWTVLGTTNGGKQLLVAAISKTPDCQKVRVDLLGADVSQIRLRVVFHSRPGQTTPCVQHDDDVAPELLRVDVGVPIAGQRLSGERYTTPDSVMARLSRWNQTMRTTEYRGFRVTGLRTADALRSLQASGVPARNIKVVGPRPGWVASTSPAVPKRLTNRNSLTLHTRALPPRADDSKAELTQSR